MLGRIQRFGAVAAVLAFGSVACNAPGGGQGGEVGGGGAAPAPLKDEAGFLEVAADPVAGPQFRSRMFYSFRPAASHPESAPLVVLFNGGPGAATTGILLPYGTGPLTLDPSAADTAPPVENPHALTRFANLLYLDARMTGYSYGRGADHACGPSDGSYVEDAADFVSAVLDFLDAHEALVRAPVVLLGESYGGTRAPMMLYMMQHYAKPVAGQHYMPRFDERVPWLRERMQRHLDQAFPEHGGGTFSAEAVARQFGWQVLIEPNFAGQLQIDFQTPRMAKDPEFAHTSHRSADDIRKTMAAQARIDEHAAKAMRDPTIAAELLGVRLAEIHGLRADERGNAFRTFTDASSPKQEAKIRRALGDLDVDDAYWLPLANPCHQVLGDEITATAFGEVLARTATFITNARYDGIVYAKAIPDFLKIYGWKVTWQTDTPAGAERPGTIHIESKGAAPIDIRFPPYEAGHEVTVGAPREFAADLEAWMAAESLLAAATRTLATEPARRSG